MTESVIADFVGTYSLGSADESEPTKGRILMSPRQMVLATESERALIPLSQIFDVRVGHVPSSAEEHFDDCVTIAYHRRGRADTAIIGAGETEIDRFTTVLFKATLNGTTAEIAPAGADSRPVSLKVRPGAVVFRGSDRTIRIELSAVVHFNKTDESNGASNQPVLEVRHVADERTMLTVISGLPSRKMNLLGRFLRLEYSQSMKAVRDLDVTEQELDLLVELRSSGGTSGGDGSADGAPHLSDLTEKGLVRKEDDGVALTSKGKMLLSHRLGNTAS